MDKREYILRLLAFFILSAAIMLGLQWASQKYLPAPPPRPAQQAQERPGETRRQLEETTTALHRDRNSTATLAETPSTTRTASRTSPSQVSRSEAPRVRLTTAVFDIEFSKQGAIPIRWDVIDPRFAQPLVDVNGEPIHGSDKRDPLIDPGIAALSKVQLPLEVILFEANARYYSEFNDMLYRAEGPVIDGQPGWRFTSEPNEAGIHLVKTYRFKPDNYVCDFELQLVNQGEHNISFDKDDTGLGLQLGPGVGKELPASNPMSRFARVDVVAKSGEALLSRELKKTSDQEIFSSGAFDWAGIQGLYYAAVLIPNKAYPFTTAKAYVDGDLLNAPGGTPGATLIKDNNLRFYPSVELYGKPFRLNAGETKSFKYEFFIGPNQSQVLHAADHDLHKLLFHDSYWFMRDLALGLMAMLRWFHMLVGNWGVAIILLTFTVRLLVFPLVHKGLKSQAKAMAEQQRIKPLMDKINERYKDDPARRQQEVMKLFKEHGVNPLGGLKGCFWMLIQLPIFFALYKLLSHSIELRGAHYLWVTDLSQADRLFMLPFTVPLLGTNHFNLLPIIVAVTQMLTSKFMTQPATDPQQAQMQKIMLYFMPVFVLFITYGFPAGLMLYWLVSNVWQVVQQVWVNKHMPRPGSPGTTPAIPVRKKA